MDFWDKKIHVTKEAASHQIKIINTFSPEKRLKIALNFANMGIQQSRSWIQSQHIHFSDLEITLEFVRLLSYESNKISEEHWQHFKTIMEQKIHKDWKKRFRKMMQANDWTYEDIAKFSGLKNGKVVEATISRGLPAFAKLAVCVFEQLQAEQKVP